MMDCKKLREVLDLYVDHELSPGAVVQAEAHIAECSACRGAAEHLVRLREAVKIAVGEPDPTVELLERIKSSISPPLFSASRVLAVAATLILAGILVVFLPGVRGSAANALDFVSLHLDDSRQVVMEGKLLCRDCLLKDEYGYHSTCPMKGHHGSLASSDGRIWNILEGDASKDLIHDSSLLGRRVRIHGRIYRKAGSIDVNGYQLL